MSGEEVTSVESGPAADAVLAEKPVSILTRRFRKFRSMKRGWYSFLVLTILYVLSWALPVLVNNRAIMVTYEGETYFPALRTDPYLGKDFGQRIFGEANYRKLSQQWQEEDSENSILMPIVPFHPNENLLEETEGNPPHKPSTTHWFGTDNRGRDVFARLCYGYRLSISFGLLTVGLAYLIGLVVGATLGFFGGRVDLFGLRVVEVWAMLPFLYTIMIVSSIVRPGFFVLSVLLGLFSWVAISYYLRGEFLREKAKDYVAAAIAQGESNVSVMFRHIFPNALTPIISFAPFAIVGTISAIVSLDFLGLGLPAPTPSWGELMEQGLNGVSQGDWHLIVVPATALASTLLMVVFVGEAIREAFDPKPFSRLR